MHMVVQKWSIDLYSNLQCKCTTFAYKFTNLSTKVAQYQSAAMLSLKICKLRFCTLESNLKSSLHISINVQKLKVAHFNAKVQIGYF